MRRTTPTIVLGVAIKKTEELSEATPHLQVRVTIHLGHAVPVLKWQSVCNSIMSRQRGLM
jgi:hypothetical protein